MIRLFITSVCLFLLEVYLFCAFSPQLLQHLTELDIKYLTFTEKQRRVVHNIQRQKALNQQGLAAIYVLGGSTSREFFLKDEQMRHYTGRQFVNMSASSQTLIDSLRLADNINGGNTTVIYCLFPLKFMRFEPDEPADSRYLMGAYLKYPIESFAVEQLLSDVAPRNLATALMVELNVYCYLLKNYVLEKNYSFQKKLVGITATPLKGLFVNQQSPAQHFYHRHAYNRKYLRLKLASIKKEIGPSLSTNLEVNFIHLGHLIGHVQRHGHQIKLLELPYSATFENMFRSELRIYRRHLQAFLDQHPQLSFKRIDFDLYRGREELFYDHGHLLDKGRAFFHPYVDTLFEEDIIHAAHF